MFSVVKQAAFLSQTFSFLSKPERKSRVLFNKSVRHPLRQGSRWPEPRGLAVLRNEWSAPVGQAEGERAGRGSKPWLPLNDKQLELQHAWLLNKIVRIS